MKIEHAALYVRDLEAEKAFFVTYFDASAGALYHNRTTGFRSYFLSFDDGAHLEIMSRPSLATDESTSPKVGYAHLAFSVGSREAVDALTERLRRDGYAIIGGPRMTGDGYYESCIADAEGNLIEITV